MFILPYGNCVRQVFRWTVISAVIQVKDGRQRCITVSSLPAAVTGFPYRRYDVTHTSLFGTGPSRDGQGTDAGRKRRPLTAPHLSISGLVLCAAIIILSPIRSGTAMLWPETRPGPGVGTLGSRRRCELFLRHDALILLGVQNIAANSKIGLVYRLAKWYIDASRKSFMGIGRHDA